jgi:alkanesulfonate monooxygenase SsuD/methylene tetrahydromethanopterin reductase-like flavin-dependent oxidoreductase (luciferase family)
MGDAATESFVRTSAQAAEAAGFTSIWTGDHVALFGSYERSTYPYQGAFGEDVPVPDPTAAVLDPLIWMTWAAAHTTTIEVGSTIVILPQ